MAIELIPDHVADGLRLLIQQYKDKPILASVLSSYLRRGDDVEATLWGVLVGRELDHAVGVQLDIIGKLVGQPRVGANDDVYRLYLRVRIAVNRSRGRAKDIIGVATLALDGLAFRFLEFYPASMVVDVIDPMTTVDPTLVVGFLRDAAGAGIGIDLQYQAVPEEQTFCFAAGDVEEDDIARGWADVGEFSGGVFVGVV